MDVVVATRAVYPFHGFFGMEKYYYNLSKNLNRQGINVKVITSKKENFKKYENFDGIDYVFLPPDVNKGQCMNLRFLLFNSNIARYLRKLNFDVLHGTGTLYPYLSLKECKPTINQLFGLEFLKIRGFRKIINYMLVYHRTRMSIENSELVACLTDFHIRELVEFFNVEKKKFFVSPVGVDVSNIKKNLTVSNISRKDLGIKRSDFVLITVNRIDETKGIKYLIDSFKLIKNKIDDAKLIIIGSGPGESKMIEQIRRNDLKENIIHLKNVLDEKLYSYYNLSDVYVSPTLQDDFITGILESMVCSLPIISTSKNVVIENGINGLIVPKKNPKCMADGVLRIYDKGLREKMGRMSSKIIKNYDWEKIVKILIKKYESIL